MIIEPYRGNLARTRSPALLARPDLRLVPFVQFSVSVRIDRWLSCYKRLERRRHWKHRVAPELRNQRQADQRHAAYDQCDPQNVASHR
jgi:hypothetical protein